MSSDDIIQEQDVPTEEEIPILIDYDEDEYDLYSYPDDEIAEQLKEAHKMLDKYKETEWDMDEFETD